MGHMKFLDRPFAVPALFVAAALFFGLWIVGWGISARAGDAVISVTGSASQPATADEATWIIDMNQTAGASNVSYVSSQITNDAAAIARYLSAQKLASSSVSTATVSISQNYSSNNAPTTYSVSESVTITTSDVAKVDVLSHQIGALDNLISDGTIISPEAPQYYISNLPALRVSLLGAAIKDAKARADQIAQSGGSTVGPLETASSGVVQVLSPQSANAEDDGQYDTSTIQKEVTETVRADFRVR